MKIFCFLSKGMGTTPLKKVQIYVTGSLAESIEPCQSVQVGGMTPYKVYILAQDQ